MKELKRKVSLMLNLIEQELETQSYLAKNDEDCARAYETNQRDFDDVRELLESAVDLKIFKETSLYWSMDDVQLMFECTDEEAKKVLSSLSNNEYVGGEVNEMMRETGEKLGLKEKEEE